MTYSEDEIYLKKLNDCWCLFRRIPGAAGLNAEHSIVRTLTEAEARTMYEGGVSVLYSRDEKLLATPLGGRQ